MNQYKQFVSSADTQHEASEEIIKYIEENINNDMVS
jgi:hypothetical protein